MGRLHYRINLEGRRGREVREGGYWSCGGWGAAAWMEEEVAAIVSAGSSGQVREVGGGGGDGGEYRIDLEERRWREIREGGYCMGGGGRWWLL